MLRHFSIWGGSTDPSSAKDAIGAFQNALKLDPHLSEAASELRHARKQIENSGGLKGFFGRRKK